MEYPAVTAKELNLALHPDPVYLKDDYQYFFSQKDRG
jgi:hypothetical protein